MPGGLFPYFRATAQTTRSSAAWSGWKAACSGHRSRWNEKHPSADLRCVLDLKGVQNDTGHDQFCNSFLQHHPTPLAGHRQEKTKKCDRSVLGIAMSTNMKAELCVQTLDNAMASYPALRGTILHSDRGAQYTSDLYRRAITRYGIRQSMNRAGGRCHDNARCESMWASEFYLSTDIDNITK